MEAWEAVRGMMEASGVGPSELSRRLGHSRSYITASIAQGSVPRLDTFARIAHECGYRLMLQNAHNNESVELYSALDTREFVKQTVDTAFGHDGMSFADTARAVGSDSWSYSSTNATGVSEDEAASMAAARREHFRRMESDPDYRDWYETEDAKLEESGTYPALWYLEWARNWSEQQREKEKEFFRGNESNSTDSKPI